MVRDIRSIARTLGGHALAGGVDLSTPVDSAVRIADFTVAGHPGYATLVVGTGNEVAEVLASGGPRAESLASAVIVVADEDGGHVVPALERASTTTIVAEALTADVVHARLVALLAGDQAAEDRLVTMGTKVLTQVARRGGVKAVVAELAHRVDGWAVLLDPHGHVVTTAGAGGLHVRDAVAVAFNRPVRVRHPGLQVHPVGQGEDLSAYLVIASREGSMSRGRDLASQAAALLDLLLRRHDHTVTERLGREVMVGTLLAGGPAAGELLHRWGVHEDSLTGFALAARSKSVDVERLLVRWLDELGSVHVLTAEPSRFLGFIRDELADDLARLVEDFGRDARTPLHLGLGSPAPTDSLARSAAEARQALEVAIADHRPAARYRALPTVAYVLERLDDGAATRIAAVLDALRDEHGRHGELTRTLEAYLAEHGTWGTTAARLGVHRQTLANRIRRIEELTGLSMSDPDDRTAAWLALRALERTWDTHA